MPRPNRSRSTGSRLPPTPAALPFRPDCRFRLSVFEPSEVALLRELLLVQFQDRRKADESDPQERPCPDEDREQDEDEVEHKDGVDHQQGKGDYAGPEQPFV